MFSRSKTRAMLLLAPLFAILRPLVAFAQDTGTTTADSVQQTGISGVWMLANISYAGMRAQGNPNLGWLIISFIFGFPGTLVSLLAIKEGSERAYGIDIVKKKPSAQQAPNQKTEEPPAPVE